ncbi:hypothetical protein [Changchengzhania lutea]|uniref:hypothetical protein n=1 Tax=Changchengzhania lutea TaxID=2049305 RepID=UPI00115DA522|nr:hypothetical protein [Changchengzhania lutea]
MQLFKKIIALVLMAFVMTSFSQCASTYKLQKELPLEIGAVYYQHWVAGVQGGGSGVNLFIPIMANTNDIQLDSVYFQGKQVKLEFKNNSIYVGRFASKVNQKQDIIMSSETIEEYNNPIPEIPKKLPFELKDNECVVSYQEGNRTLYYKISKITKKESARYPSVRPN